MADFFGKLFKKEKKSKERRRSSLEEMGSKSQLSEEELQDLHDLSERERLNIESQTIRTDGAAALRRLRQRPKRTKTKSRRKSRKRDTSFKSLRGEKGKFHDYRRNREDYSDMRPRDEYGNLIIPSSPPPTVRMRIHDFEKASQDAGNHMGGKTRKRRRKRRRKTKRKGRRKTKKRRKRRKRKTRRKR